MNLVERACDESAAPMPPRTDAPPFAQKWDGAPELALVIPVLNEADNVAPLVERLNRALAAIRWEAIFVDDDSPDGTADVVRALARAQGNIRCVQRLGRRGLSSACIEGILSSAAPYVAVMDGDLQHDETLLPQMLGRIQAERLDIVIASRYTAAGSVGDWERSRVVISDVAGRLSRLVVKADLSDPMSGFFMVERNAFAEVPLTFRQRLHGESKLDTLVAWEYLMLVLQKLVGPAVPVRFLLFSLIGGVGVGVHLT